MVGWAQVAVKVSPFLPIIILKPISGTGCGCCFGFSHPQVSSARSHCCVCHLTYLLPSENSTPKPPGHMDPAGAGRAWDVPLPVPQPQWLRDTGRVFWLQRPSQPSHVGCGNRNKGLGPGACCTSGELNRGERGWLKSDAILKWHVSPG